MKLKIVHRVSGLPLRKYLTQYAVKPINTPYSLEPGEVSQVRYLMSENGSPGFSYPTCEGRVACWLDKREFEVVIRQPLPSLAEVVAVAERM